MFLANCLHALGNSGLFCESDVSGSDVALAAVRIGNQERIYRKIVLPLSRRQRRDRYAARHDERQSGARLFARMRLHADLLVARRWVERQRYPSIFTRVLRKRWMAGSSPAVTSGLLLPDGQISDLAVQPRLQKYFCFRTPQITSRTLAIPCPQEGRFAVVTDVGCGMRWTRQRQARERARTNDAFADGEVVWS